MQPSETEREVLKFLLFGGLVMGVVRDIQTGSYPNPWVIGLAIGAVYYVKKHVDFQKFLTLPDSFPRAQDARKTPDMAG